MEVGDERLLGDAATELADGSRYDREAKSVDAVNVAAQSICCGTSLCAGLQMRYRVITNYTDGLQSRIAIARTPDNTYAPLADSP